MKLKKIILVLLVLLTLPIHSIPQGITYFSNLGTPSGITTAVASDSWRAAFFQTGTNTQGYLLDSIQCQFGNLSNSPAGIIVSLHDYAGGLPGNKLGTMTGVDPSSSGVYGYSASGISLQPSTYYFIVLKSLTPVSTGYFNWSIGNAPETVLNGWRSGGTYWSSSDGLSWSAYRPNPFQYAINATAVPEPATSSLIAIGVLALGLCRRKTWRQDIESRAC